MGNTPNNGAEEIDLLQLFGFFEQKIKSILKLVFIGAKTIYEVFIAFLQILQKYAIKIAAFMGLAFALGYVSDMYKPKVYSSTMMIKPMYEGKFQLVSNIDYYNALIANRDSTKLASIFEITKDEASNLSSFKMNPGPENELEKIKAYDEFIKSVDSTTAKMVEYDKFIEEMSMYNSSMYEITVESKQKDIFLKLDTGFEKTFQTKYSVNSKKKKDSIFKMKKISLEKQISDVEKIQEMYTKELSKVQNKKITTLSGTPVIIGEEQKKTREFDALQLSLKLRNELTDLGQQAIKEDKLFEVVSAFPAIGTVQGSLFQKMKFMFPIIAFILSLLAIFGIKFNNYIKNYKLD